MTEKVTTVSSLFESPFLRGLGWWNVFFACEFALAACDYLSLSVLYNALLFFVLLLPVAKREKELAQVSAGLLYLSVFLYAMAQLGGLLGQFFQIDAHAQPLERFAARLGRQSVPRGGGVQRAQHHLYQFFYTTAQYFQQSANAYELVNLYAVYHSVNLNAKIAVNVGNIHLEPCE